MKSTSVLTITPRQCNAAIALTYLAQEFMPKGKRFGLFIWGASGIGKNAFTDYAPGLMSKLTKNDHGMIDFNCTANNPEDVKGLPWIKRLENGGAITDFAPIYEYDTRGQYGIFRCDEMDRPNVTQTLQAVVKYAIDRTDDQVLPLDWFVIGQGNGCSDRNTVELSDHIKGRFIHVYASINSDEARRDIETYLSKIDADPAIKALWRLSPCESNDACFKEHAQYQPRTVEFANCLIKAVRKYGDQLRGLGCPVDKVVRPLLAGAIGVAQANELFRLMEFSDLPTLGEIVNKPSSVIVPDDLSLAVKYVNTLCDFVSNDQEAKGLETYIKRFPAEITRMGLEKLASLWSVVQFPKG
jgi:hypothetical protein